MPVTSSASTGNQLYRQRKHRQQVIHVGRTQATSYTDNPPKHRQAVIHAAPAQATSYTGSASYTGNAITGNQLYRQPKHRQPVIQAIQDPSLRYHLYRQP